MKYFFSIILIFCLVSPCQAWWLISNTPAPAAGGYTAVVTADMEENDLTDFDSTVTDSGDLSASSAAALNSTSYGMSVLIDDTTAIYGRIDYSATDFTVNGKFKLSFYFDPNSLTMTAGNRFQMIKLEVDGTPYNHFIIDTQENGATYELRVTPYDDTTELTLHSEYVSDAPHLIEIEIERATTDSAADGTVTLTIDGTLENTWSNVDNFNTFAIINNVDIGARSAVDAGTSGTFYLDEINVYDDF